MKYRRIDNEVIFPLSTVADYRNSDDAMHLMPSDQRWLIEDFKRDHPELAHLVEAIVEFVTPLFVLRDNERMLTVLTDVLMAYNRNKTLDTKERTQKRLYRKITRVLSEIYHYDVYAMTSDLKLEAENKHWDCTKESMRTWLRRNKVNKLSIQYNPIQTNLSDIQLGCLSARILFSREQMDALVQYMYEGTCGAYEIAREYQSGGRALTYSNDNVEWINKALLHHSSIMKLSESLLSFMGTELRDDDIALVDIVMSEALSSFYSVREQQGASYAYALLIETIVQGVERVLDYRVTSCCGEYVWRPYSEPYSTFKKQLGETPVTVIEKERNAVYRNNNVTMTMLPMVLSRTDMATLTLPIPGCNATRRGGSVISEYAEVMEA